MSNEWPYNATDEQVVTAAEHMAEADHVQTVEPGAPAQELRQAAKRISVHDLPDEVAPLPGGSPFTVTLYFRNGLVRDFWVTKFATIEDDEGYVTGATWEQADPKPDDELLQHINFNEVILATTRAVEVP
jgi:hypothetical protein